MLLRAIALLILVVIAYIPACRGDFIWDDNRYVSENLALRSRHGLWEIWFHPTATVQYYPLTFTSFWLEFRLWGLNPAGYHWVNVLLHGLNALLLWRLLSRLQIPFPWLAAAIFALHPVQVESVAWITERKNVLSGFFYLIAFLAYLRFSPLEERGASKESSAEFSRPSPLAPRRSLAWYAVSLCAFAAALFSKTVSCSLPAVLVLVIWWKRGWPTRREALALLPMFALGLVLAMHTARMERDFVGASGEAWTFTPVERCLIAGRALWFYVGKLLWPHPLIFNYERWHIDAHDPWQYLYPLSWLAMLVLLAWMARGEKKQPNTTSRTTDHEPRTTHKGPLTALLIFSGTLLPALGFFNVYPMLYYFVADHYQYLACIAMICLAMAAIQAAGKFRPWIFGREGKFLAGVLLLVLGCLTWMQGHIYRNVYTLWQDTRTKNPDAWMAHYNLGRKAAEDGNFDLAIDCCEQTIRIDPRNSSAYNNWGVALRAQGGQAEAAAMKAKEDEDDGLAKQKTAEAMAKYDQALEKFELAAKFDREDTPPVHYNVATIYLLRQDYEPAIASMERALAALAKHPDYPGYVKLVPDYEYALAFALLKAGRRQEALPHAQRAAEFRPNVPGYQKLLEEARAAK